MAGRILLLLLTFLCLSFPQLSYGEQDAFLWRAGFNPASSPDLRDIHESIYSDDVSGLEAREVSNLVWTEPDLSIHLLSGVLYLEPEIQGYSAGAFFEGKATVSFAPGDTSVAKRLERYIGKRSVIDLPVSTIYIFTLRSDSPLRSAGTSLPSSGPHAPANAEIYRKDKSAMRLLGFNLTWTFLNRSGPAKGATYILFPIEDIRIERSLESRILYAQHPMMGITLAVFGHHTIAEHSPFKYNFSSLVSYEVAPLHSAIVDVDQYAIQVSFTGESGYAEQQATIKFKPASDLRALRMRFTNHMQISAVTDSNGGELPFLQWEHLKNDPNFDQTILLTLPDPGTADNNDNWNFITITSKGTLFDSRFNRQASRVTLLQDEEHWYPRPLPLTENDDAHYEIDVTFPKRMTVIGPGSEVLHEKNGRRRRVVYRTNHPSDDATFLFGRYTKVSVPTDTIDVDFYHHKRDINSHGNAKRIAKEIASSVDFFSRTLGPLDITTWRATPFGTRNTRFVEGLVYGCRGLGDGTYADYFQAHRVAHQWWGSSARAAHQPEDFWLEEALANFSAMQYFKTSFDDEAKLQELFYKYMYKPLAEGFTVRKDLTGEDEKYLGRAVHPLVLGRRNIYIKGPMVMRMLDYLFTIEKGNGSLYAMLKEYQTTHRYGTICTSDFQAAAEKALGADLDWFFRQWVREEGIPAVLWHHAVTGNGDNWIVRLDADQRQGRYRLLIPVYLHYPGGKVDVHPWRIDNESSTLTLLVPDEPTDVTLNDNMESLVILNLDWMRDQDAARNDR